MTLRFGAASSKKSKSAVDEVQVTSTTGYDSRTGWAEKYAPRASKELVLHHSKIKATRDWLLKSVSQEDDSGLRASPHGDISSQLAIDWNQNRILILCGCSGCGKSTMIQALCSVVLLSSSLSDSITHRSSQLTLSSGHKVSLIRNCSVQWRRALLPLPPRPPRGEVFLLIDI
jgi:ABC-type glutathione transport system ATPase component